MCEAKLIELTYVEVSRNITCEALGVDSTISPLAVLPLDLLLRVLRLSRDAETPRSMEHNYLISSQPAYPAPRPHHIRFTAESWDN